LKSKLVIVILVLVLAAGIVAPLHAQRPAQQTQPKLDIDIARNINAGQYGVGHISDKFTLLNNGTTSASYLDVAIPRSLLSNLTYVDAQDSSGNKLTIEADVNKTSQFYWMRVHFAQDLASNKNYTFTMNTVLGEIVDSESYGYLVNMTAAPVLAQDVRMANVTFFAPTGSAFRLPSNSTYTQGTINGYPTLTNEYKPWNAYSDAQFTVIYTAINQYLLDLNSLDRQILIGSDGSLGVKETYTFHNPSSAGTSLTITLPDGAYNVMTYDEVGALSVSPQNPTSPYQIQLQPRGGTQIMPNENFTVTVTYNVPQSKYVSQLGWWGSYNLTFALIDNKDDLFWKEASVTIVTPDGASITNFKLSPQSPVSKPIQIGQGDHSFKLQDVTTEMPMNFGLTLSYIPFLSALPVLPWLVGLEIAILAFALFMRIRRPPELAVPIPVEKLREFVELYDERLALTRELVVMEEEVNRGGLVKHEFRRRRKVMDLRLDELNKALMALKAELRSTTPQHEELIRRIDRAEGEIATSRASINQVRDQYRSGRITRETYDSLMNDISKRIDRAEEAVETSLITLREQAR
jgi:hypothetical protein